MVVSPRDHLGFTISSEKLRNGIFIPKYYNPEIPARLKHLSQTHVLWCLGALIKNGHVEVSTGHEIGKMAYGTGSIPFVRTSDIGNNEIKNDPKQGISRAIYNKYASKQDVKAGDILLVRDGTYLIGQSCMVTSADLPCLYQSHILKFRVTKASPIPAALLLASFNTPIVQQQIRSFQFTADIIDTIGDRYLALLLPIPRDSTACTKAVSELNSVITKRAGLRGQLRTLPLVAQGLLDDFDDEIPDELIRIDELNGHKGFVTNYSAIRNGVFIPKYYNPLLEADIMALGKTHELVRLGDLCDGGKDAVISWETGIEVGKMAYGTGNVPFVRTSDISNWEVKGDPKQSVSDDIYSSNQQDVRAGNVFVVRDGTYLVGTSCILTERDTKILFCGGLYKLRVEKPGNLDPYLMMTLLNMPIVRRQMRARQFTRDIIDTLGRRLFEITLPIPKSDVVKSCIAKKARKVIEARAQLRDRIREIATNLEQGAI